MNLTSRQRTVISFFLVFFSILLISTCLGSKNRKAIILVGDESDLFYTDVIKKETIQQLKISKKNKKLNIPGLNPDLMYYDFNSVGQSKHLQNVLGIKESYLPLLGIAVIDSRGQPVSIMWRVKVDDAKKAVGLLQRKLGKIAQKKVKKRNSKNDGVRMKKVRLIVVHGYAFRMKLYEKSGDKWNVIKEYPIGIGKGGMGKTREGDKKTPIGKYKIIWKASRFWKTDGGYPIVDGKAFCGPNNMFTKDPNVGYPSESLWKPGYGGKKAVVMCIDYPNAGDKRKGYSGGCIEIHATLLGGIGKKSSMGCIRMKPNDARELYNLVDVGTMVILKEE
ncbi:MAG: L,D-transpeptidase [Candidatus Eremiobacteraeota bacterium]|nr:L,D-transpeptidase [Candidatus Eremiobacteraeota bacterium]